MSVVTLTDRLATFFRERPGVWIDGRVLGRVAGAYAWRTACSRLRRGPFLMTIDNRQLRRHRPDGTRFTISEYCFIPATTTPERCQCGGNGNGNGWISTFTNGVERLSRCACRQQGVRA